MEKNENEVSKLKNRKKVKEPNDLMERREDKSRRTGVEETRKMKQERRALVWQRQSRLSVLPQCGSQTQDLEIVVKGESGTGHI